MRGLGYGYHQFEYARWAKDNPAKYKFIKVERVNEDEKRWNTVLQNIITVSDSTLLRTAFVNPYEVRQHIFYRNKWWEITNVGEIALDVAPQALALTKDGNLQYVLEVVKADGYDA